MVSDSQAIAGFNRSSWVPFSKPLIISREFLVISRHGSQKCYKPDGQALEIPRGSS